MTMKAMITREVPRARFSGMRSMPTITGTMTTPPPIPSNPEANPAPSPIRKSASAGGLTGLPVTGPAALPAPTRTACQPIRAAVASRRNLASITLVRSAPPAAPTVPGGAAHRAAR